MNGEKVLKVQSGWKMLPVVIGAFVLSVLLIVLAAFMDVSLDLPGTFWGALVVISIILFAAAFVLTMGFFTLQPNEARVIVLFGTYKGTVFEPGFYWANPFYTNGVIGQSTASASDVEEDAKNTTKQGKKLGRYKLSLRARTLTGEKLKVNDKLGNPVEIASVIVWRVRDTYRATFDVDDYMTYVRMQSETALRHVASLYAYDRFDAKAPDEITLRGNIEEVSEALKIELGTRLAAAGVSIDDARLTHLAYSPEIAQAMLRRQQADAIIAARERIVEGAVGMVDMALAELSAKHIVELDDERKASMVSNLMVVLCGESEVHPIVNAGTLYN